MLAKGGRSQKSAPRGRKTHVRIKPIENAIKNRAAVYHSPIWLVIFTVACIPVA
jgi:hypothetical protein